MLCSAVFRKPDCSDKVEIGRRRHGEVTAGEATDTEESYVLRVMITIMQSFDGEQKTILVGHRVSLCSPGLPNVLCVTPCSV